MAPKKIEIKAKKFFSSIICFRYIESPLEFQRKGTAASGVSRPPKPPFTAPPTPAPPLHTDRMPLLRNPGSDLFLIPLGIECGLMTRSRREWECGAQRGGAQTFYSRIGE